VSSAVVYGPQPLDKPADGNLLACCSRLRASARGLARSWPVAHGVQQPASKTSHMVALVVEGAAMTAGFEAKRPAACDGVMRRLRRRLAGLEAWTDGPVKAVAREALREEMARLGREMVELEWRWA
jgi:hypothetical protein